MQNRKTVSDVVELVSQSIHQLRRGQIDPESCSTIGFLSSVLLGAMEKDAMGKDAMGKSSPAHWQAIVSHPGLRLRTENREPRTVSQLPEQVPYFGNVCH